MIERQEIEKAIAALEAQRVTLGDAIIDLALASLKRDLAEQKSSGRPSDQRRQVTVLFADLAGYTALAESMDPEDLYEIMNQYFMHWKTAIENHGGIVEKFIGDAVMAVFGLYASSEQDAKNAILAALTMRQSLREYNRGREQKGEPRLAMRIGVNTGAVVVSAVKGQAENDFVVVGDTVNVANRLQSLAPLDGILIARSTYRHVCGHFDVEAHGRVHVKGKADPIPAYVVVRVKPLESALSMRGILGIEAPMIGREAELAILQTAFAATCEARRLQIITVVGEAGIGKSRLLYEFRHWAKDGPAPIHLFRARARPETRNLPYALFRDLLATRFHIQENDSPAEALSKLQEGYCGLLGGSDENRIQASVVGQLTGFDAGTSPYEHDSPNDPQELRDRALLYLASYIRAACTQKPTIILLEDINWADESSLDSLEDLASGLIDQPLLIVAACRPEFLKQHPTWCREFPFHRELPLRLLPRDETRQLVGELLREIDRVPHALEELIVGRAGGNPYFVEELIKMLMEDGVISPHDQTWAIEPYRLATVRIPPTLTGILQARLDGLPPDEREILKRASVIGRTFWNDTVAFLLASPQEHGNASETMTQDLGELLDSLSRRELIFPQDKSAFAGSREYVFKHALLRDVAYDGMLKRQRRSYHAQAATWFNTRGGKRVREYSGLIAEHLLHAGSTDEAIELMQRAGEQAAARFAHTEALKYLTWALELMDEKDYSGRFRILLILERIHALRGDREAQQTDLAAMEKLSHALRNDQDLTLLLLRKSGYSEATSDYSAAIAAAQQAVELSRNSHDMFGEAEGYLSWGIALRRQGDFHTARTRIDKALEVAQGARSSTDKAPAGSHEPRSSRLIEAIALNELGVICSDQGEYANAGEYQKSALDIFREINDRRGEARALDGLGISFWRQGNMRLAPGYLEQAHAVLHEIGDRRGESMTLGTLAKIARSQGDTDSATDYYERALRLFVMVRDRQSESIVLTDLGVMAYSRNEYVRAKDYFEKALHICRDINDRFGESIALGNLGLVCMAYGHNTDAEAYYQQALDLSRQLGHRVSECTGLTYMGLLSHREGNNERAMAYAEQALQISDHMNSPSLKAAALTLVGHASTSLGDLTMAEKSYREAKALRDASDEPEFAIEAAAGLARVSLAAGDIDHAHSYCDQLTKFLARNTLDVLDDPFQVYLTSYEVLRALDDSRAREILRTAHRLLKEHAARITDPTLRKAFLHNVAAHLEILRLYEIEDASGE